MINSHVSKNTLANNQCLDSRSVCNRFLGLPHFFISPLTSHFYKIIEIEKRKNILFRNTELFTIRIVKDYRHNT